MYRLRIFFFFIMKNHFDNIGILYFIYQNDKYCKREYKTLNQILVTFLSASIEIVYVHANLNDYRLEFDVIIFADI